jgi:hypothetical protein
MDEKTKIINSFQLDLSNNKTELNQIEEAVKFTKEELVILKEKQKKKRSYINYIIRQINRLHRV